MIPEEIKRAITTIDNYKKSIFDLISKKVYICICCRKNQMKSMYEEIIHPLRAEENCWVGGAVERVNCGYGSNHDTDSFFIGICDDCIDILKKEELIISYRSIREKLKVIDENGELF